MAFNQRQVFPNDLRPRVAIGFNLPLNGDAVFNSNYQTRDAIKANLINYFLTNPGERLGNPEFGGGLRAFIFSQIAEDNLEYLKEDIQEKLLSNFPNVILQGVDILQYPDSNSIVVKVYYSISNTNINDQLELNFN